MTATIGPLDPDSPAGQAATEALSQVLADIQVAIWQREAAARAAEQATQPADAKQGAA